MTLSGSDHTQPGNDRLDPDADTGSPRGSQTMNGRRRNWYLGAALTSGLAAGAILFGAFGGQLRAMEDCSTAAVDLDFDDTNSQTGTFNVQTVIDTLVTRLNLVGQRPVPPADAVAQIIVDNDLGSVRGPTGPTGPAGAQGPEGPVGPA